MLKMYIAVLDEVPDHMVPVVVAHATLGAHLDFSQDITQVAYETWLKMSFRKVVLKVNRKEFEKIRELPFVYHGHENSILGGDTCCLVVCPREDTPRVLAFAKMWKPNDTEVANKLFVRIAQLEKQISNYGWEQDQRSYHRMGL